MNLHRFVALAGLTFVFAPLTAHAQEAGSSIPLRYKFTAGERLRYLVMRDPYFADPARAVETADPRAPYRAPSVERLTEEVRAVGLDGTATVQVTVSPEPGFEDESHPIPPLSQTLRVTPLGEIVSPPALSPNVGFLRAFFRLPAAPVPVGKTWPGVAFQGALLVSTELTLTSVRGGSRGLAVITQSLPPQVKQGTSPDHDGTLLQTTRSAQSDRIVFDAGAGNLLRQTSALTVTVSLTMTNRGRRGSADFGHVVPNLIVVQTMTIERKEDVLPASASLPSPVLTQPQLKN